MSGENSATRRSQVRPRCWTEGRDSWVNRIHEWLNWFLIGSYVGLSPTEAAPGIAPHHLPTHQEPDLEKSGGSIAAVELYWTTSLLYSFEKKKKKDLLISISIIEKNINHFQDFFCCSTFPPSWFQTASTVFVSAHRKCISVTPPP